MKTPDDLITFSYPEPMWEALEDAMQMAAGYIALSSPPSSGHAARVVSVLRQWADEIAASRMRVRIGLEKVG